ncbi:MAG: SDR family oxidoreductase [Candidatus Heimdallarchaeota archaeon]|nr:SDR family oxidoreductase [Candidatus Heimdallarchaeota archaeon]
MTDKNFSFLQNCKNAIITGASSGIGLEYAKQLAARKINLILLARRKDRLEEICQELSNHYDISVTYISVDLSKIDEVQKVCQEILKISPVDILINCAGFATLGELSSVSFETHSQMITLHINTVVALCHSIIPKMQEQNRGIIINVASIGAFIPTRGNSVYSATKAFLITFSENINLELERTNIIVQAICPGFTKTEFHQVGHFSNFDSSIIPRKLWMSVTDVVSTSLAKLKKNKVIVIPGLKNRLFVRFYQSFIIQTFIKSQRKKALKKSLNSIR